MAYPVLYVDDNERYQDVVSKYAGFVGGITVTTEPSAEKALDLLASGSFDGVIADFDLSAMDGITFLKTVRSRCGDLPVILLSAEYAPDIEREAIRNGAVSVHFMPFTMAEFRDIVSELTTAIGQRREGTAPGHMTLLDQDALDSLPGILALCDSGWHLVQWNRYLETLTGYAPEELAGMSFRIVLTESWPGDDLRACMRTAAAGKQVSHDVCLMVRTGERIPYLITVRHLEIGGLPYFAITGTDIRKRREAEDTCTRALSLLSLRYKVAEAVVQRQVPVIQYAAESMQGRISPEERDAFRDRIMAATDELIERIRNAPPGCENLRTGEPRWQDTEALLRGLKMPAGITLVIVPPLPEVFVNDLLEKVFVNLFDHAGRHGGPGTGRVTKVRVFVRDSAHTCVLQVEFDGTYISWDDTGLIFRNDYRGVHGINLYQATQALKLHRITVQPIGPASPPTEYSGACFLIRIPDRRYRFKTTPDAPPASPAAAAGTIAPAPAGQQDMAPALQSRKQGAASPQAAAAIPVIPDTTRQIVIPPPRTGKQVSIPATGSAVAEPQEREPVEWEERFRVLTENLPNAVLLMDRDLRFRYASPRVLWKFGKNPHLQVTGKTPAEIGLPDHVVRFWKDAAEGVFSSGKLREIEFRPEENSEPVCWSLAPVHGPDGSVTGVLAVDRWKAGLADEASCPAVLKEINLLNGINRHDILNRATVIAANLAMIRGTTEDPRTGMLCDMIREGVDAICDRVNATRFWLDVVPRELRWQEVAAVLAPLAVPAGIRLEAVPPLPVVFADIKLPMVFSSLIQYTGKYSGGVSTIRISAQETPEACVILVEDNGTGIPEEEKKRIFNYSYSDHRDFDLVNAAQILSETHIGIRETGTPGEGIRFEMSVPKGWYRFGTLPAQPGEPPGPGNGKEE